MFQREPTRVIGYIVTALVAAYAKWQGLETEDVLAQLGALIVGVEAIRTKVTPYIESVQRFRNDLE